MALGGLLVTLDTPIAYTDEWGNETNMTERLYDIELKMSGYAVAGLDPVACTVRVYLGKVMTGVFTCNHSIPEQVAMLTRSELVTIDDVTIAALIAAANTKLGLT